MLRKANNFVVLFSILCVLASCSGNIFTFSSDANNENSIWQSFVDKLPNNLKPYKSDIVQGNYITIEMVSKLQKGQSKIQVLENLGTPLLVDPFRNDRWDYIFYVYRGNGLTESRSFTIEFLENSLSNWFGDPIDKESGQYILPSRSSR